jgi:cell division topological specificity factor
MGIFDVLFGRKQATAATAKERLLIVMAHERASRKRPDFLPQMKRDILAAVAKYIVVDDQQIQVKVEDDGANTSVLEINIELGEAG